MLGISLNHLKNNIFKVKFDSNILLIFFNIVSFLIIFYILFTKNNYFLFFGLDGSYMLSISKQQFASLPLQFGLDNNLLQGIGNIWFPLNTKLLPGFISLQLFPANIAIPSAYTIFAFELFVATLIAGNTCRLSWSTSVLAAWILPFIAFPVFGFPILYEIMMLVPNQATLILCTVIAISSFSKIGLGTTKKSIFMWTIFFFSIIYIISSQPASIIISASIITIFSFFSLLYSKNRRELNIKIFSIASYLLIFSLGPIQYVLGIFTYTAPYFFPSEFLNDRASPLFSSILFHGKVNSYFFIFSALGVVISLFDKKRNNPTTIAMVTCMTLILVFGFLSISFVDWRGPSPLYFEFMLWPFYALFLVKMIGSVLRLALYAKKKLLINSTEYSTRNIQCLALFIFFPWLSLLIETPHSDIVTAKYPPESTNITQYLQKEISLLPGNPFRGRVATFTGITDILDRKTWIDLNTLDQKLIRSSGNDHRMVGLWYYNIPTLLEYSPLISPAFHSFGKRFLTLPQDGQIRNIIAMRNIQIKFLQSIGVRFIVTDVQRNDLVLRIKMSMKNHGFHYLYEIPTPNLGQYSPRHAVISTSLNETLDILNQDNFDFVNDFVTSENIQNIFVTASDVNLHYGDGFIDIKASSNGTSILALPIEFSHCLSIENNNFSKVENRIIRINLLQTGLIFEKFLDTRIRYFTGPFNNPGCRIADSNEFKRLISKSN